MIRYGARMREVSGLVILTFIKIEKTEGGAGIVTKGFRNSDALLCIFSGTIPRNCCMRTYVTAAILILDGNNSSPFYL